MEKKDNTFTFRISSELKKKLKEKANESGKSAGAIVIELLTKVINQAA